MPKVERTKIIDGEVPAFKQAQPVTSTSVHAGVTICKFCKHEYLKPCNDKTHKECPNYLHLVTSTKTKRK